MSDYDVMKEIAKDLGVDVVGLADYGLDTDDAPVVYLGVARKSTADAIIQTARDLIDKLCGIGKYMVVTRPVDRVRASCRIIYDNGKYVR